MDYNTQRQLDANIREAFKKAVVELANEATKVISKPTQWQGFSGVRDIVDIGQLRASQQIVFVELTGSTYSAEIRYPVEYAAAVHNGATIRYRNGNTRRISARPWMRVAAKRKPIDVSMSRTIK